MLFTTKPKTTDACRWHRLRTALLAGTALLGLLGGALPAMGAALPAGTVIRNVATAIYQYGSTAAAETVSSNTVIATVAPAEALALTQDQTVSRPPGSTATLSHLLKNIGNVPSQYTLTLANNAGGCAADTLDLGALRLVHDINRNGVADGGEPQLALAAAGALQLNPGETAALLVQGTVPSTATGAACVALSATTALQNRSATNRDTVQVNDLAVLTLTKSASVPASIVPGATRIDFAISGTNIGARDAMPSDVVAPTNSTLLVNGVATELVLLRDVVPTGTQYIAGTLQTTAAHAIKLYRLPADPPFSYRTAEDASAVEVAIGISRPVLRNASVAMQFAVKILASQSGDIRNTAQAQYHDGLRSARSESNTVVFTNGASIGIAKAASEPRIHSGANGKPSGNMDVRFQLNVRNYGSVWLHDIQVKDVMEGPGAAQFGTFTTAAVPGANEYTIVPGSVAVVSSTPTSATATANASFKGTAGASDLLAGGAALPPAGQIAIGFVARVNTSGRSDALANTARTSAALMPGGSAVAADDSVDGSNPDPNGDGDPTNDRSPTPVPLVAPADAPTLALTKQASPARQVSAGVFEVDYSFKVTNTGKVVAPNVRVIDNLDCAFLMADADGPIASWKVQASPKTSGGKLAAANGFTGRAACNEAAQKGSDPMVFPTDAGLSLTDGDGSLAPGESEQISLTVQLTEKQLAANGRVQLDNKAWAVSLRKNTDSFTPADVLAAASATGRALLLEPQGTVYDATTRQPVAGATVTFTRRSCSAGTGGPVTAAQLHGGSSGRYRFNVDGSVSMTTGPDGSYQFHLTSAADVGLCTYGLSVTPPGGSGYVFPSQGIPAASAAFTTCGAVVPQVGPPQGNEATTHHLAFSAGVRPDGSFCDVVHNHIPLDRGTPFGLVLRKDGSKRQAELGDFIDYALTLTNKSGVPLHGVTFHDALPPGFGYVAKSARLNGAPTADPAGGAGPALVFDHPTLVLAPEQMAMVRYRLRIGVGAPTHGEAVKRRASGRVAFFFKGAIQGEYLLTAAYDSDKTERERLFRDIRPDEFYPVYGDSAARGFDAQSTQKLYVRIDKDRSFLLYGDFTTASSTEVRSLSQTSRSLTGLKHVYEGERVRITSYASRTAQTQQVEEFRAVGTSGPYHLSAANGEFVANSEQVEVLVRDRNQPDTVLQRTAMTRFVDYTVEPLTRRILFTRAIASVDPNLNPQSIRVSYEVDSGGPKFTVAGTDVQVKVNEALQLGVVAGVDENPQNRRRLHAATALARIGERTTVAAEAVQTRSDLKGQGEGARVEARYQDERLAAVGLAAKTSEGFDNPGASFSAGRTEGAVRAEYKVDPTLAVRGEVLYGKDAAQRQAQSQAQNDARRSAALSVQKKLSETTTAEVGLRHSEGRGVTGSNAGFDYGQVSTYDGQLGGSLGANSVTALGAAAAAGGVDARSQTTVRARLSTQVPHVPKAQVFVEGEQDVNDSDRRVLAVGGNYAVTDKTRVYGRYELISSLYGPQYDAYSLDGTQRNNIGIVGVESNYMTGGRLYNEYRISDGAEGRGVQSAIGVRNTVSLTEQLRVTGGIEHTRDLSGYSNSVSSGTGFAGGLGQSTAITTGVEYLTERLKTSGVFEARNGEDARTRLMSAGFAYKLDPSWSLLARSIVSTSEGQGANAGNARNLQRHQIGVAYRPVEDDTWNALARYERRSEEVVGAGNAAGALNGSSVFGAGGSGSAGLPGRTSADIVSAHVNFNPQRGRYLTARYAGKWSRFDDHTLASGYWAHLLHARYTQDIDKDWDFGVQGGLLFGKGGALHKTFGVEVGYQVYRNLWVSLGYNFVGLHERDLTANAFTSKGAYIRLRFKFDETDFGFSSAGGATDADPALR